MNSQLVKYEYQSIGLDLENFKIENFLKSGGMKFPTYQKLSARACDDIFNSIKERVKLEINSTRLDLVNKISRDYIFISDISDEESSFSVKDFLFKKNGYVPKNIYINWNRFESIDKIKLSSFEKHLYDIWYPSVDDIDIFDEKLEWIAAIDHSGCFKFQPLVN